MSAKTKRLIFDANILINLDNGGIVHLAQKLPYDLLVPDLILPEYRGRSDPLHHGFQKITFSPAGLQEIVGILGRQKGLSFRDAAAFQAAKEHQGILMTGDKTLRTFATNQKIETHGDIWLLEKFIDEKIITRIQAQQIYTAIVKSGAFLPEKKFI